MLTTALNIAIDVHELSLYTPSCFVFHLAVEKPYS